MTIAEVSKYTPEEYEKYATWHWLSANEDGKYDAHLWRTLGPEVIYLGRVSTLSTDGTLPEQIPLVPGLIHGGNGMGEHVMKAKR